MSVNLNSSRLQNAKGEVISTRVSVNSIRNAFRDKFYAKLKLSRSKCVDRSRQIVSGYGESIHYKSISDLRRVLLLDQEVDGLLQTRELNDILKQIENELAEVQLEQEGVQYMREIEDIIERHLGICIICDTLNGKGIICARCSALLDAAFE